VLSNFKIPRWGRGYRSKFGISSKSTKYKVCLFYHIGQHNERLIWRASMCRTTLCHSYGLFIYKITMCCLFFCMKSRNPSYWTLLRVWFVMDFLSAPPLPDNVATCLIWGYDNKCNIWLFYRTLVSCTCMLSLHMQIISRFVIQYI
jgi:hypothetical protein